MSEQYKQKSSFPGAVVIIGWLFLFCSPANASIYVDIDATAGSNNGTSWSDAYTNLNTALTKSTGEFWIAEGTYITPVSVGIQINNTNELYGGFHGTESSRTERNWTTYPTILDGGSKRVLAKTVAGNGGRINLGRYGNTREASRTTGEPTGGVLIVR